MTYRTNLYLSLDPTISDDYRALQFSYFNGIKINHFLASTATLVEGPKTPLKQLTQELRGNFYYSIEDKRIIFLSWQENRLLKIDEAEAELQNQIQEYNFNYGKWCAISLVVNDKVPYNLMHNRLIDHAKIYEEAQSLASKFSFDPAFIALCETYAQKIVAEISAAKKANLPKKVEEIVEKQILKLTGLQLKKIVERSGKVSENLAFAKKKLDDLINSQKIKEELYTVFKALDLTEEEQNAQYQLALITLQKKADEIYLTLEKVAEKEESKRSKEKILIEALQVQNLIIEGQEELQKKLQALHKDKQKGEDLESIQKKLAEYSSEYNEFLKQGFESYGIKDPVYKIKADQKLQSEVQKFEVLVGLSKDPVKNKPMDNSQEKEGLNQNNAEQVVANNTPKMENLAPPSGTPKPLNDKKDLELKNGGEASANTVSSPKASLDFINEDCKLLFSVVKQALENYKIWYESYHDKLKPKPSSIRGLAKGGFFYWLFIQAW